MTNWKNNRPDNWDAVGVARPLKEAEPSGRWVSQLDVALVNAGADAIYEAIKDRIVEIGKEVGRDDLEFRVQVAAWLIG